MLVELTIRDIDAFAKNVVSVGEVELTVSGNKLHFLKSNKYSLNNQDK